MQLYHFVFIMFIIATIIIIFIIIIIIVIIITVSKLILHHILMSSLFNFNSPGSLLFQKDFWMAASPA